MLINNFQSRTIVLGLLFFITAWTCLANDEDSLNNRYSVAVEYGAEVNGGYAIKALKRDATERFAYGGIIGKDQNSKMLIAFNTAYSIVDTMYGTPYVGINLGLTDGDDHYQSYYGYNVGLEWWNYDSMSMNTYYSLSLSNNHLEDKWSPGLSLSAGVSF